MSFFKNIFGENKSDEKQNENVEAKFFTLNNIAQFDEIDEISHTKPVVLFKHSTRCIISRTALKQFDAAYDFSEEKMNWYLLDLLNHRDVSNEIASRYNVVHQSPQIVVIKKGKAIFSETHDSISVENLKQFT